MVEDFLSGAKNEAVVRVQRALESLGLPQLSEKYSKPSVESSFDDLLTYKITTLEELYGVYPASWDYLFSQLEHRRASWIGGGTDAFAIEKTINDLTEKSIRDYEIVERWRAGTDHRL